MKARMQFASIPSVLGLMPFAARSWRYRNSASRFSSRGIVARILFNDTQRASSGRFVWLLNLAHFPGPRYEFCPGLVSTTSESPLPDLNRGLPDVCHEDVCLPGRVVRKLNVDRVYS